MCSGLVQSGNPLHFLFCFCFKYPDQRGGGGGGGGGMAPLSLCPLSYASVNKILLSLVGISGCIQTHNKSYSNKLQLYDKAI